MELAGYSPAEAAAINWPYTTIANIKFAPLIAVHDALETAEHDPRSLIGVRRELERSDPDKWQAIKCGRILRLAERAFQSPRGNIAARVHTAFSRQGTASHLQAILTGQERKAMLDLMRLFHAAARVRPLGPNRMGSACAKATRIRSKGAFGQIVRSSQPALAFLTADEWLGTDPDAVEPSIFVRVMQGDPRTMETMNLIRSYASGDWRWRFLFGRLVAESEHYAQAGAPAHAMGFYP